jgi:hypothetical protein
MRAELAAATAESFAPAWFDEMEKVLMRLSDEIAAHYFLQGHSPEMTMTLVM